MRDERCLAGAHYDGVVALAWFRRLR